MPIPKPWGQRRGATWQHMGLRRLAVNTGRAVFTVTKWFCMCHLFTEYVGGPRIVQGPSMLPTMNVSNEIVMEDTLSPRLSSSWINRGHLVSLLSPLEPTRPVCKRVIGLPGDTICVYPDKASMYRSAALSGGKDSERQSDVPVEKEPQHVIVPEGHIWISGDNIPFSRDSSVYGPVPIALVRGKIFARLYPSPRWFNNPIVYID